MIAYVDSSVLLAWASDRLTGCRNGARSTGSVQCFDCDESLRTLDRLRIRAGLADTEIAVRRAAILNLIQSLELIEIDSIVLERAAQPMPTELGTLDAIHLASAILWKDATGIDPVDGDPRRSAWNSSPGTWFCCTRALNWQRLPPAPHPSPRLSLSDDLRL